jgi:exonuclease III
MPSSGFIFYANVNGIRSRSPDLCEAAGLYNVIVLQETRLSSRPDSFALLSNLFPSHRVASFLPHDHQGVGSCILVHQSIPYTERLVFTHQRHRLLSIEVRPEGKAPVTISSLYAPAFTAVGGSYLRNDLLEAGLFHRRAILVGDLNAKSQALGCQATNSSGKNLLSFLNRSNVLVLNDPREATYQSPVSGLMDCLDWCLATPAVASSFLCSIGEDFGSDHLPLLLRYNTPQARQVRGCLETGWHTSGDSWQPSFARHLHKGLLSLGPLSVPTSPQEVETLATSVEMAITEAADSCLRRSRPSTHLQPSSPWRSTLARAKRNAVKQLARNPGDRALQVQILRATRAIRRLKRDEIHARYRRVEAIMKRGPAHPQFWYTVRKHFERPTHQAPTDLSRDSSGTRLTTPATSPLDKAGLFAQHLSSTADARTTSSSFDAAFFACVEQDVGSDRLFQPISDTSAAGGPTEQGAEQDEPTRAVSSIAVQRAIRQLRSGRAPGPDKIGTDLVKAAPFTLAWALSLLFSGSLSVGYLPSRWKAAWIRMIPKPGKPGSSPSDFRPIALTSTLGKLLERIVARRLEAFCDARGLLPAEQSGFRTGRDASEQTLLLCQRAVQASNGGLATAVAALDITGAYDSVWHRGLLYACREVLTEPTCRWIAAFLAERSAAVLVDGYLSQEIRVALGVPQGSPLSPLLYNFFTRTLPLPREPRMGATAYADDLALWASEKTPREAWSRLQPYLEELLAWSRRWRLHFSEEKTQAAILTRRCRPWRPEDQDTPSMGSTRLQWARHVDLLGIRMDGRFSLVSHAHRIQARLRPRVEALRRLLSCHHRAPTWVGVSLTRAYVRSALLFSAPLLLMACDTTWRILEPLERRCLRTACHLPPDAKADEVFAKAGIPPLREAAKEAAGRFLVRHCRRHNKRLFSAFCPEVKQRRDYIRVEEPLFRALACVDPSQRQTIDQYIRDVSTKPLFLRSNTTRASARRALWLPDPGAIWAPQ